MDSDFLDMELNSILNKMEMEPKESEGKQIFNTQDQSLEKLLEEIIESSKSTGFVEQKTHLPPAAPNQRRFKLFSAWVSACVLGSFLLGSAFGLVWSYAQKKEKFFVEMDSKLSLIAEEVRCIHQQTSCETPAQEIIEPLAEPSTNSGLR